jgi:hypothetical protein
VDDFCGFRGLPLAGASGWAGPIALPYELFSNEMRDLRRNIGFNRAAGGMGSEREFGVPEILESYVTVRQSPPRGNSRPDRASRNRRGEQNLTRKLGAKADGRELFRPFSRKVVS